MKKNGIASGLLVCVLAGLVAGQGAPGKSPLAGWPGAFPKQLGYQRTFLAPGVEKRAKPQVYSQTVRYEWTGGAARRFEVTAQRDPTFKKRFSEEALEKDPGKPRRVMVGNRTAWLWDLKTKQDKDVWAPQQRLVVPLGADRAVIVVARGPGPWAGGVEKLAATFDLGKLEKALESPPRTDFRRRVELFRGLRKGMSYDEAVTWVGDADRDIGKGIHIMAYQLEDGSRVLLGFPDFNRLLYAKHESKGGKVVDLVK